MATNKERLAATIINHWYVIKRGFELKRLKKKPASKKYASLVDFSTLQNHEQEDITKGFVAFNLKHFVLNLKSIVEADQFYAENGIVVKINNSTAVDIEISIEFNSNFHRQNELRRAMQISTQEPTVLRLLDSVPTIYVGNQHYTISLSSQANTTVRLPVNRGAPYVKLAEIEQLFSAALFGIKTFVRLTNHLISVLTIEQVQLVKDNKVNIIFSRADITNDGLGTVEFSLQETEDVRAARRARERLEEALKRRALSVKSVSIGPTAISYAVENQTGEAVPNIDIIVDNPTW